MSDYRAEQLRLAVLAVLVADSSDEAITLVISEITRRTEFLGRQNALDSVRDDLVKGRWGCVLGGRVESDYNANHDQYMI